MKVVTRIAAIVLVATMLSACSGASSPSIDNQTAPAAGMPANNDYMYRSPSTAIMRNPSIVQPHVSR